MAFTGTAVVKQISDGIIRITGLSLTAGSSGIIGLHLNDATELGPAASFGALAQTFANSAGGSTINGDLGYEFAPAINPTVNGTTFQNNATYFAALEAAANARKALKALKPTFSFSTGNVNLGTDTTHGAAALFTPGIYEINGNATIPGSPDITLSGRGLYVFQIEGVLNIAAASAVVCASGASPGDVFWVSGSNINLSAGSVFVGTGFAARNAAIIATSVTSWEGRAFAPVGFATVSVAASTITAPLAGSSVLRLPSGFLPAAYTYKALDVITLQNAISVTTRPAAVGVATAVPISVVKSGTTRDDFFITLTNTSATASPALEIIIRDHE